jgi:hypothetical protein
MNKLFANIHNQPKSSIKKAAVTSISGRKLQIISADGPRRVLRSTENDDAKAGKTFEYLTER